MTSFTPWQEFLQLGGTFAAGWLVFLILTWFGFPASRWGEAKLSKKKLFQDDDSQADRQAESDDSTNLLDNDSDAETDQLENAAAAARGLLDRLRPPPPSISPPPPPPGLESEEG